MKPAELWPVTKICLLNSWHSVHPSFLALSYHFSLASLQAGSDVAGCAQSEPSAASQLIKGQKIQPPAALKLRNIFARHLRKHCFFKPTHHSNSLARGIDPNSIMHSHFFLSCSFLNTTAMQSLFLEALPDGAMLPLTAAVTAKKPCGKGLLQHSADFCIALLFF